MLCTLFAPFRSKGKREFLNAYEYNFFDYIIGNGRSVMSSIGNSPSLTAETIVFNNGKKMSLIGFGTFRVTGKDNIFKCLDAALKAGYRSIDTAAVYGNEQDIGKALKEFLPKYNLTREDIYITSKLAPEDLNPQRVERAVAHSCNNLQTKYLDLYLIHWPGASGYPVTSTHNAPLRSAAWQQLVELNKRGVLHSIGVSNYTVGHLKELLEKDYGVPPAVNQVELHPHYPQTELISFCREHNIAVQAYGSLGGSNGNKALLSDPEVERIAKKVGRPISQVLLRWALQQNILIIPKSLNPERIASNVELNFEIPNEEMTALSNLSTNAKYAWDPTTVV